MPEEMVERVRRGYDVFNRLGVDGMLEEFWAEDVVMDSTTADLPGASVYRGLDEVREFFAGLFAVWEYWVMEPTKILDAGDRFLVFAIVRGRDGVGPAPDAQGRKGRSHRELHGPGKGPRGRRAVGARAVAGA